MNFLRRASHSFYPRVHKLLTPRLRHSQYAYRDKLNAAVNSTSRWLDAGCGHGLFPEWIPDRGAPLARRSAIIVGIDCDCPSLWENQIVHHRVVGDLGALPFQAGTFDLISANMVVEHIANPELVGKNLNR